MTFCVARDTKAIRVAASWGQYLKETKEEQADRYGNLLWVWRRHPRCGSVEVPVVDGSIKPQRFDEELPGVCLDGLTALQSQALVTAEVEGKVPNGRLQEVCADHPTDLSRTLQGSWQTAFWNRSGMAGRASTGCLKCLSRPAMA